MVEANESIKETRSVEANGNYGEVADIQNSGFSSFLPLSLAQDSAVTEPVDSPSDCMLEAAVDSVFPTALGSRVAPLQTHTHTQSAVVSLQASLEMLWWMVSRAWLCFSCCLLLSLCSQTENVRSDFPPEQESGEPDFVDWEMGSGSSLLHLFPNFPADSPFIKESPEKPINCTQRFWLPPSSPVCWETIAEPEEFAKSRLLALQNRAALQAVFDLSGVEETGISYNHQAREEVQGIQSDHQKVTETIQTMETVFVSLQEKRKEGKDHNILTSIKERLSNANKAIHGKELMANNLESRFSTLEKTLLNIHLRLSRLFQQ
ncbi:uncharacterized protein si:ch211-57n23.1 [Girardinichthys multiradiatus]|uniref:uncharacterized protein si:ch211-57n23.1 n=1 Tax=Girardinichthys multiradiatus TaxID=208333 RepID=UPI001FAC857B|nr:uncharacterized protein si:ch211-57n23.1 [Girardinichthys multiradiatus]